MYSFAFHSWNVRSESSLISSFQQTLPSKYFLLCSDTFLTFFMYIAFLLENSSDEAYVFLYFLTKLWNWKSEAKFWVSNSVARYICKIEVSNKYVLEVQTSRKWLTVAIFRKWHDSSVVLWIKIAVILLDNWR